MMLNEYEIIAWALWLDNIPLEDDEYTIEEKTLFTALFVKITLNQDKRMQEIFQEFLAYIKNFIIKFNTWIEKNSHTFQPHPIGMNQKYIELSRPYNLHMEQDFVEYNHVVDEILQISPPYQSESPYAAKYMAPEIKPGGVIADNSALLAQTPGMQKILIKRNPERSDILPLNDLSKNSFGQYPGILGEYNKGGNSFDSLRDGLNSSKNIEMNKKNMKGIAHLIDTLQGIYNIEGDDTPIQPPSFKTDSLFKSNPYGIGKSINKPEAIRGNSMLEFKNLPSEFSNKSLGLGFDQKQSENDNNKAYSFLKDHFKNSNTYVKFNPSEFQIKDEEDKPFDQSLNFEIPGNFCQNH